MADEKTIEAPKIDAGNSLIQKRGQTAEEAELNPRKGTYSDVGTDLPKDAASKPGDPGNYAGEYAPAESGADEVIAERDDLPEGYVPGAYAGPYTPVSNS